MKKIAAIFLMVAFLYSFYIAYHQTAQEELIKIETIEESIAKEFEIPNDILLADADKIYPILFEAAIENKINLFRTNTVFDENDQTEKRKYVLLTNETKFFDVFRIKEERFLTAKETQQDNYFLSTTNTNEENQVGIIKDFGNRNHITIKPLKEAYDYLPFHGRYFAETPDDQSFDLFLKALVNKLNILYEKYEASYSPEHFAVSNKGGGMIEGSSWLRILEYSQYMIFIITLVLLIYYIFNESKKIGIMKLYGISNIRLWFLVIGRLITVIFILMAAISLVISLLVRNTNPTFVLSTTAIQFKTYLIIMAISLISYLFIKKIKISQSIKNKKETNGIFGLNSLLKVGLSLILVFIGFSIWSQYTELDNKKKKFNNWESIKDYGIIYPVHVGKGMGDLMYTFDLRLRGELYPILNKMNSILINSHEYEEEALIRNKNWNGIRSIKVNNNYLQEYPVYDVKKNPIHITEDTKDWILLVPEKYRDKEKDIRNYFEESRKRRAKNDQDYYKREVQPHMKNQKVEIVWLENNQRIFSFNPEVFPKEDNVILDPIIEVVTEHNSLLTDRDTILGGGPRDPLKIRLINRDTSKTYKKLEPELKRLELDDNLKHLITIDQYILKDISDLQKEMNWLLLVSIGLLSGLVILVAQNLIIFFNKNQQKIIVRRLFGISFFRTYKEYMLLFSAIWIFLLFICFIASKVPNMEMFSFILGTNIKNVSIKMFIVALFIFFFELIASIIALIIIEQRNKLKVIKGG